MNKQRIELLDSFRFIAILFVLFYHLTAPWIAPFLHKNWLWHISKYGYLGVHFFFIISGFVISYTLENTPNLFSFYRNRFSRLFPAMLLCSLITFAIVRLLDTGFLFKNAHEIKNFIPGLTFTNPTLWTCITKTDFHWLNGSYWSLWPEVQFYFVSSGIYFLNKENFFRNMLIVGMGIGIMKYIPIELLNNYPEYVTAHNLLTFFNNWKYIDEIFSLSFYIFWFLFGVIFYRLYKKSRHKNNYTVVICLALVFGGLIRDTSEFFEKTFTETVIACILMLVLFILMIYKKKYIAFLENSFLRRIGIISYSIYLLHENIGVLLIHQYGHYLGNWSLTAPFVIIILIIAFAELSYRFYEKRAAAFLKMVFSKISR